MNTWDLAHAKWMKEADATKVVREMMPFVSFAPIVYCSAKSGYNIRRTVDAIDAVASSVRTRMPTGVLNRTLVEATRRTLAPMRNGRRLKVYYGLQVGTDPLTVRLFVNDPKLVTPAYQSYVEKAIRSRFGLEGAPLRLFLKARSRKDGAALGAEIAAAKKELDELSRKWPGDSAWQDFLKMVHANEAKGGPGPYDSKLHPYAVMSVDRAVLSRAVEQDKVKDLTFEMHVTRVGDVAMVTCPFELYLAYGQVIKARSPAAQTFVVTKCGNNGYLPTMISENSVGYSGGINVGKVGHEGGFRFCDLAVGCIKEMFATGQSR